MLNCRHRSRSKGRVFDWINCEVLFHSAKYILLEDEQESKCGVFIIGLMYAYFDIYRLTFCSCLDDLRCLIWLFVLNFGISMCRDHSDAIWDEMARIGAKSGQKDKKRNLRATDSMGRWLWRNLQQPKYLSARASAPRCPGRSRRESVLFRLGLGYFDP